MLTNQISDAFTETDSPVAQLSSGLGNQLKDVIPLCFNTQN